jgi:hypothetical protein
LQLRRRLRHRQFRRSRRARLQNQLSTLTMRERFSYVIVALCNLTSLSRCCWRRRIRKAYAHKSNFEIARSLAVLKLCSWRWLVVDAERLLSIGKRVIGQRATMSIVKRTFFAHFCAGEDVESIRPTIDALRRANINPIMDYAAEADVKQVNEKQMLQDVANRRSDGVVAARTYQYEDEAVCDANRDLMLECVENAASLGNDQFIAIKLTALAKPELLEKISSVLLSIKNLWINEFGSTALRTDVNLERFVKFISSLGVRLSEAECRELFARLDLNNDGIIDYIEWTRLLSFESLLTRRFFETRGYDLKVSAGVKCARVSDCRVRRM